ncbi:Putative dehydrogenase [Sphingomonas sp. LH128]|uniref:Gfo/Idh/MocA family protein n=1 Tax=Sphingomonas sp. LH128 TaxID=473781 RepID=UPI00027CBF08|nr:Gfo/Idh/MocA family oxidoreductase [Sphingomonas sp. LH128]EJU14980.1 Putative dehydrogenase [Sphingomonas sp. LH128]
MTDIAPVRWGIIGSGWISTDAIAPALNTIPEAVVHSVCSRDPERASEFAKEWGARPYADLDAFLADPDLDAVFVATPNARHPDDVFACARAGKHVLCDKPLAPDGATADRMVAACAEAGVLLGTGYQMRFHPIHVEMARRVAAGDLGRIIHAHVHACFRYPFPPSPWRRTLEGSGGGWATGDLGTHLVDLLLWLLGPVRSVQATMDNQTYGYETEDICSAVLAFEGGTLATLTCSTAVTAPRSELGLYGESGSLIAEQTIGIGTTGRLLAGMDLVEQPVDHPAASPYQMELTAFSRAVRGVAPLGVSGRQGADACRVLDAIRRSAREGGRVTVDRG